MATKKITVDISHRTIIFTLFLLLLIIFFQNIAGILIGLFIALLVSVATNPFVNFLEKRRIPRWLSAFLILFTLFSSLIILAIFTISPLIKETQNFVQQQLPGLIDSLAPYNIDLSTITAQLSGAPRNVARIALGTFSGIITFFTLLVITYYFLKDRPNLKTNLAHLFGDDKAETYFKVFSELELRLGAWVRGELMLMLIVGLLSYFGFVLIGLPYAIPLAVIAGLLELVPNIGPTIAAIPAVLVGFSVSPTHGFMALGLTILIQQLENNLIVPKIMQQAIGLHPVVTIVSLLVGFELGGPLLAVLSLPIILGVQVILPHFRPTPSGEGVKLS